MWGAYRRAGRAAAILLAVLVAASGCGGGEEPAADGDGEQEQEFGQSLEPGDAVAPLWPHCADYDAVLAVIARADSAEPAVQDAKDAVEEAGAAYRAADAAGDDVGRFDADQSRLNALIALADAEAALADAIREYDLAADAAVASAEALVTDTTAESDARSAGQRAIEALAAATDATLFAVYGQTSVGLGTPAYNAAYEVALAAALGEAGTGRVTAEARIVAAERAVTEARILVEAAPSELEAAWEAAAAAATAEAEAEAAAYADAEAAAAAARAEADVQAAVVEAIASISVAVGDADDNRADVAFQAAREAAYNEAEDNPDIRHASVAQGAAGWIADMAARDAAYAAQAALVVRLDELAERARFMTNMTAAHEAAMSAWVAAWPLAEDADWLRRLDLGDFYRQYEEDLDRGAGRVFDRQPAYDDLAYRAAARAVRSAVASSVPSSESVAAAEAEAAHWAVGGSAHRAFVAARDRIASARAGQRGRIHPGTDLIAWDAYHVALDLLESAALAEAADIRADAASRAVVDIETDPRVIEARAAVERSEAAVTESQAAVDRAQEAVWEAESELAEARSALEATRPPYDRAARAAWKAVGAAVGCR